MSSRWHQVKYLTSFASLWYIVPSFIFLFLIKGVLYRGTLKSLSQLNKILKRPFKIRLEFMLVDLFRSITCLIKLIRTSLKEHQQTICMFLFAQTFQYLYFTWRYFIFHRIIERFKNFIIKDANFLWDSQRLDFCLFLSIVFFLLFLTKLSFHQKVYKNYVKISWVNTSALLFAWQKCDHVLFLNRQDFDKFLYFRFIYENTFWMMQGIKYFVSICQTDPLQGRFLYWGLIKLYLKKDNSYLRLFVI